MKQKSRNLSVAEYFIQVQKEYLIADFRRKIYYNPKDKAYYERVMGYKKEKIEDISKRNNLSNIFNSTEKLAEVSAELFDLMGNPKFEMDEKDLQNYYSIGNEFSHGGEIWILDQVNVSDGKLILYSPSGQKYNEVNKGEVCRIL